MAALAEKRQAIALNEVLIPADAAEQRRLQRQAKARELRHQLLVLVDVDLHRQIYLRCDLRSSPRICKKRLLPCAGIYRQYPFRLLYRKTHRLLAPV